MPSPYDLMSNRAQRKGMLQARMHTSTTGILPHSATEGELHASYCPCRIPGGRIPQLYVRTSLSRTTIRM